MSTVSKTTTQEKARPAIKYCSTCAKCGGETYWHGDTWYHESGRDVMKCGVAEPQTPPDSLTAELQKENARLTESLQVFRGLFAGDPSGEYVISRADGKDMGLSDQMRCGRIFERVDAALSKEKE